LLALIITNFFISGFYNICLSLDHLPNGLHDDGIVMMVVVIKNLALKRVP
jgi:hypothetical protein